MDGLERFSIKDSGQRQSFAGGMVRDVTEGKILWMLLRSGPMLKRWAVHLTKGAEKYGRDNWLLAAGQEEYDRFRDSAARHFEEWLEGDRSEDHAAAVIFNLNGAEYVRDKLVAQDAEVYKRQLIRDQITQIQEVPF